MSRLFATYAAISLLPVVVLGVVLAASLRGEARKRGLAEGRSEATLVARTAVEPLLTGRSLDHGLTPTEQQGLRRLAIRVVGGRDVLRLRVRDLAGHVVFSADGSGFKDKPEDEALDAARGHTVTLLTHLNSDVNDIGRQGVASVEVYQPLRAGTRQRRVGVLELYLPYAPISRDVTAGLHGLYLDLGIGLVALYLALFAITASVSRGLRREAALNAFLAAHDALTELPNRTLFHHRAQKVVAAAIRSGGAAAIAIIDLDRFKDVNDTLGHHLGDDLLTQIAARLAASMRIGDTVARLGGDEFAVILDDVGDANRVLWRLREIIEREVELSGLPLSIQASVGFVVAPDDGTDVDTLLQRADVAMYVAKAQHTGVERYDATLDHYDPAKLSLVGELRHAIDDEQLVLHYQPQMTLADGCIESVEALVRWQHPTYGLLYPDKFLPLAEQTDVIDKLTEWVLCTALSEVRDLDQRATAELAVAVNVSARSIGRMSFADQVLQTLTALDMPAERLIIEVTETTLLTDPSGAAAVLAKLSAAGVRVGLDDFGRGHTSLAYLSGLPAHQLKIDKSFVLDMLENSAHAAIVRSIIDLGHNLDLSVVGEGVETVEVLAALKASGCDVAQGFLLATPMPASELDTWLTAPRTEYRRPALLPVPSSPVDGTHE